MPKEEFEGGVVGVGEVVDSLVHSYVAQPVVVNSWRNSETLAGAE